MKVYKEIKIPHLRYSVKFADMKYLKGIEIKGGGFTCISGDFECTVFFENIEKTVKDFSLCPYVAHELVHVLQILCEKFSMKFENEQEHMAYLMTYILTELQK